MKFKIRELVSEKDREIFLNLAFESFKETIGMENEHIKNEFDNLMNQFDFKSPKNGVFICTTEENIPVGFIWISIRGPQLVIREKHAWIYDIFVNSRFRGQKLGSQLMKYGEKWTKDNEIRYMGLNVFADNDTALKLYRNFGYKDKSYVLFKELE